MKKQAAGSKQQAAGYSSLVTRYSLLPLLGLALALIGYWGPWVNHKTAALVLSGLDMSEYVKFLAEVKWGTEPMVRELFYLPPLAAALCLALLAANERSGCSPWMRGLMLAAAVALALVVLPAYPFVLRAPASAEFRWQFAASVLCLLFIVSYRFYRRLSASVAAWLLMGLAFVGAVPPLWQFFSIRNAIERVYSQPIELGWGLWLTAGGFLIVAAVGATMLLGKKEALSTKS